MTQPRSRNANPQAASRTVPAQQALAAQQALTDAADQTGTDAGSSPKDAAGKPVASNRRTQSNFDSNYPDGAAPNTGLQRGEGLKKPLGKPTASHDDEYGSAPPRDQIRPPEMDIAAAGKPAAGENVPTSVTDHDANNDYMRHFAGAEKAKSLRDKAGK